jgi:hypothetical protein
MAWYWPTIEDKSSAEHATKAAVGVSGFIAAITALLAVLSIIYHKPIFGLDGLGLIDAAIFALIAWRISKVSRTWAVVGLLMYLVEVGFKLLTNPSEALARGPNYHFHSHVYQCHPWSVCPSPLPEGRVQSARTTHTASLRFARCCALLFP